MANVRKSGSLNRRRFIRGAGLSLALPALDCMATSSSAATELPKRLAAVYFSFGVSLPPKEDSPERKWYWFPNGEGRDFQFNESLKPLEPHREKLSVLGGLSHPKVRRIGGHDSADTFLTGWDIRQGSLRNVQSMDQIAAEHFADQTRYSSLIMSTDGGVGEPTRASTLSFNRHGRPIPALNQPRQIFERLFGVGDLNTQRDSRRLRSAGSMLDLLLDDAKSIRGNLGKHDQDKLDEYLDSVRQVEQQVERSQAWVEIPKPELSDADREMLNLDSDDQIPTEYIQTMYDLIYLAFRTDSTRVATYQITSMGDQSSKAVKFPQLLGFGGGLHKLAHGWNKPGGAEKLGMWDQFLATQFARFLDRMDSTPAGPETDATLLDQTTILYGSSNSTTHTNRNYPLIIAGGDEIGFKHGQYLKFDESTPFSNVLSTMLDRVGVQDSTFGDSTGIMPEILG
ncbi:MAG: DUF1552 domain-containing protein [Verrucomicrobiota bacterium]